MSDLQTLFDTDPLKLSAVDLSTIITEMRKSRHQFNLGNVKAGSTKPKTEKQKETASLLDGLGGISI